MSTTSDPASRAERLARLYRLTLESEASESTRAKIKEMLLSELSGGEAAPEPMPIEPPVAQSPRARSTTQVVPREGARAHAPFEERPSFHQAPPPERLTLPRAEPAVTPVDPKDLFAGPLPAAAFRQPNFGRDDDTTRAQLQQGQPAYPREERVARSQPPVQPQRPPPPPPPRQQQQDVQTPVQPQFASPPSQQQYAQPSSHPQQYAQPQVSPQQPQPPHQPQAQHRSQSLSQQSPNQQSGPPQAQPQHRPLPPQRDRLELRVRQMVEANADWRQIEPLAIGLYQLETGPVAAARLAELAFLKAPPAEVTDLLAQLIKKEPFFYQHMHPAVRAHLVARMWAAGASSPLGLLMLRDGEATYIKPFERLFAFYCYKQAKDREAAYIYFRRHRRELLTAASELGGHVGLTLAGYLLTVGRLAFDLGFDGDARDLLEQIEVGTEERDQAIRLMLGAPQTLNGNKNAALLDELTSLPEPMERVRAYQRFLSATRELGGIRDKSRPELNELLKDPTPYLGETSDVWATFSDLLAASRDLLPLLPNLYEIFVANALRFQPPLLDQALWSGPLGVNPATPRDRYWRGVAALHFYLANGPSSEAGLWDAKMLIAKAQEDAAWPLPYAWRDLHKAAFAAVAKRPHLAEVDRLRMLRQMRVAVDFELVALSDLEEYAEDAERPPIQVLDALISLADAKKLPTLEARLILKRAELMHLTNRDLDRLWRLATERKDTDQAWRIATVLHARQALAAPVRLAWEISGEKRTNYPFVNLPRSEIKRCLTGLSPQIARLAHDCITVGPLLPELLALLDPGSSQMKSITPPSDSVESKVDSAFVQLDWLDHAKRRTRFSFEAAAGATQIPAFMQILPANTWSLMVAKLAERLGINAWGWRLSRLQSQIVDLIPRIASRQDLKRHSGRVAKWLKDLTPEQRVAWQDLATLSRTVQDDEAVVGLGIFLCRLSTVLLPNHLMALTSLQAMRVPTTVLWSFETWLLGSSYSEIRKDAGIANRVLVPNALTRLESVLPSPPLV